MGATLLSTNLTGLTITGSETYTDANQITITHSTVEPGGELTLKAGDKIILGTGFHAKPGSGLTTQIDQSSQEFHLTSLPPTTGNDRFLNESLNGKKKWAKDYMLDHLTSEIGKKKRL